MSLFFADEDFPRPVVVLLRHAGHDVLIAVDAGIAGKGVSDEQVLASAHALGRCLLTLNRRDFIALHSVVQEHSGIVVCTHDKDWQALAERIHLTVVQSDNLSNRLIRIYRPRT